jgi:hypothetical protein
MLNASWTSVKSTRMWNWQVVAVGTIIADRPPHRTVRAALPHTAPTLEDWRAVLLLAHRSSLGHSVSALCRTSVGLNDVLLGPRPFLPPLEDAVRASDARLELDHERYTDGFVRLAFPDRGHAIIITDKEKVNADLLAFLGSSTSKC